MLNEQLYANPYNSSVAGFYFTSYEEYQTKSSKHVDQYGLPIEEYEIDHVDGDLNQLFNACNIDQCTLHIWFNEIETMDKSDQTELYFRCDCLGQDPQEAICDLNSDGSIGTGSSLHYAYSYIEDSGILNTLPENIQRYFDFEAFARDLEYSGDITEFSYDGEDYTATGF